MAASLEDNGSLTELDYAGVLGDLQLEQVCTFISCEPQGNV